jgi:hypothetical protein
VATRGDSRIRLPLVTYAAIAGVLLAVQHLSARMLREPNWPPSSWPGLRYFLDGWSQFDGPRYQEIAELGYRYVPGEPSNIVWFPGYPLLLRVTGPVTGDYLIGGIITSLLAGAAALVAYWWWLDERGFAGAARTTAFAVLALYPYGWYLYGVVHADALFLLLVVSAFLLVERDRTVLGGLVAAAATATRPTGMAIVPALLLLALVRHGALAVPDGARGLVRRFALPTAFDRSKLRPATLAPLLSLLGLGAWMLYLGVQWGDPFAFATNQATYHPVDHPYLKANFFRRWIDFSDDPVFALTITAQAAASVAVALLIPAVCRRLGFAYGLYLTVLVAIPTLTTGNFMGTGRYLIAAFPAFAVAGERLAERPRLRNGWLVVSGLWLVVMAFGFSRSIYLS